MILLYIKAVHIIFVVSWFAGLFYIVRLFIYHVEAEDKPDKEVLQGQFSIMERRLWNVITTPAMILTLITGIVMLIINPPYLQFGWMLIKIGFVLVLLIYHLLCGRILRKLRIGTLKMTSGQLRLWNELATLLLVAIVFIVVLKTTLEWVWGLIGMAGLALLLVIGIRIYKRFKGNG